MQGQPVSLPSFSRFEAATSATIFKHANLLVKPRTFEHVEPQAQRNARQRSRALPTSGTRRPNADRRASEHGSRSLHPSTKICSANAHCGSSIFRGRGFPRNCMVRISRRFMRESASLKKMIPSSNVGKVHEVKQKAQEEDRFLRGKQMAIMIYGYFRMILDFSALMGVTFRGNVLGFHTKWDAVLLSIHEMCRCDGDDCPHNSGSRDRIRTQRNVLRQSHQKENSADISSKGPGEKVATECREVNRQTKHREETVQGPQGAQRALKIQNQHCRWVLTHVDSFPKSSFGFELHWRDGRSDSTSLHFHSRCHYSELQDLLAC